MMTRQQYLLLCLIEEAGEVAHAASKVSRFTAQDSYQVTDKSNLAKFIDEMNDLVAIVEMLEDYFPEIKDMIDDTKIDAKKQRVEFFMERSRILGVLEPEKPLNHEA